MKVWTLVEARELITQLQLGSRSFNYHIALGGSVLNKGESDKDLDLYFLPMDNGNPHRPKELIEWLSGMFGPFTDLGGAEYEKSSNYKEKVEFRYEGKRIDVFIAQDGEAAQIIETTKKFYKVFGQ